MYLKLFDYYDMEKLTIVKQYYLNYGVFDYYLSFSSFHCSSLLLSTKQVKDKSLGRFRTAAQH